MPRVVRYEKWVKSIIPLKMHERKSQMLYILDNQNWSLMALFDQSEFASDLLYFTRSLAFSIIYIESNVHKPQKLTRKLFGLEKQIEIQIEFFFLFRNIFGKPS